LFGLFDVIYILFQSFNVLTETPSSFAALPVLMVLSMRTITHYHVV